MQQAFLSELQCKDHQNQQVKYICCKQDCKFNKLCCSDCLIDSHSQHEAKHLQDFYKYLEQIFLECTNQFNQFEAFSKNIYDHVEHTFDIIIQQLVIKITDYKQKWLQNIINDKLQIQSIIEYLSPKSLIENEEKLPDIIKSFLNKNSTILEAEQLLNVNTQELPNKEQFYIEFLQHMEKQVQFLIENDINQIFNYLPYEQLTQNFLIQSHLKPQSLEICQQYTHHQQKVNSLLILDDFHFASGSSDETLQIWKFDQHEKPISCIQGLKGVINHLTLIDPETLACRGEGQYNNQIYICNWKTCEIKLIISNCHDDKITKIECINQSLIASCSWDAATSIKLWNCKNGKELAKQAYAHENQTHDIIKMKQNYLISTGDDKYIRFWDIQEMVFKCKNSILQQGEEHCCLLKLNEEQQFASGSFGTVCIWNVIQDQHFELLHSFAAYQNFINCIVMLNRNVVIISAQEERFLKIISKINGKIQTIQCDFGGDVIAMCKIKDNQLLLSNDQGQIFMVK